MNKEIMRKLGFLEEMDRVEKGICPLCGFKVNEEDFKDSLSRREFKISGMCQKCQDGTFTEPVEEN